jgi:hypothetical protein
VARISIPPNIATQPAATVPVLDAPEMAIAARAYIACRATCVDIAEAMGLAVQVMRTVALDSATAALARTSFDRTSLDHDGALCSAGMHLLGEAENLAGGIDDLLDEPLKAILGFDWLLSACGPGA